MDELNLTTLIDVKSSIKAFATRTFCLQISIQMVFGIGGSFEVGELKVDKDRNITITVCSLT